MSVSLSPVTLADAATTRAIAGMLLDSGAVRLAPPAAPFTWTSGWKSPIYCDNRLTLSHPTIRTALTAALAGAARQHYPEAEGVAGVATAGIPQGTLLADRLALPFCYVRPQAKGHGLGNQIEGRVEAGQRVVVVEDLVSTGSSSLRAVEALRAAGAHVVGMLAVFTYGFQQAEAAFARAGVPLLCLSDYEALLAEAAGRGTLTPTDRTHLAAWRQEPETWGQPHDTAAENASTAPRR